MSFKFLLSETQKLATRTIGIILESFESGLIRIPAFLRHGDLGVCKVSIFWWTSYPHRSSDISATAVVDYRCKSWQESPWLFFVFFLNFSALTPVIADQGCTIVVMKCLIYRQTLVRSSRSCFAHVDALLSKSGLAIYDPEGIDDLNGECFQALQLHLCSIDWHVFLDVVS